MVREDDTGIMEKPMAVKHLRLGEVRNGVLGKNTQSNRSWVLWRLSLLAVISCASVGWSLLRSRFSLQRLLGFQFLFCLHFVCVHVLGGFACCPTIL